MKGYATSFSSDTISSEELANFDVSFANIKIGRAPSSTVVLAYINKGSHEWVSSDEVQVFTKNGYLYKTMVGAKSSAKYIYETSKTTTSTKSYPKNPFAKQLKTTAEFINSKLDTKVYYVSMGGFDTHANQANRQARLLKTYSEAMEVFVKDLEASDSFKDTLILTFSEFGRRVQQNAASGTDHGAANNLFIIGKDLNKPGIYNDSPDLSNLDNNGDLKYTIDFRSVYATLLDQWLGASHSKVLGSSFETLDFI